MTLSCAADVLVNRPVPCTLCRARTFQSSPALRSCRRRSSKFVVSAQDQDRRPFNEGAAQVKKLLNRDKRELMGAEQIGERARTEFDEDDNKPSTSGRSNGASSTESTRLFGEARDRSKSTASPFGGSGQSKRAANPFGTSQSSTSKPFTEPENLSPFTKPLPVDDTPWYKKITLSQVVIVISFTLIIGLMLATTAFVVNVGAVRFNE